MEYKFLSLISADALQFKKVAEEKSFSRASDKAGLQQAGLSKAVARLEDKLGGSLLVRRRSGLELTELGQRILRIIDKWSGETIEEERLSLDHQDELSGHFRMGANEAIAKTILPQIWPLVWKICPKIHLELELGRSPQITRRVLNRDLDLGVVANPARLPDLVIHPLRREGVYVYLTKKAVLSEKTPLLYNPGMIKIEPYLKKHKGHPQVAIPNYDLIAAIAGSSEALAILPGPIGTQSTGLALFSSEPIYQVQISLIHRRDQLRSSAGKGLLSLLKYGHL